MALSPRDRRLYSDHRALQELRAESSIFNFECQGNPPNRYRMIFTGTGLWRAENTQAVQTAFRHEVLITLTNAYPRMIPELSWQTPIFHPNISAGGVVCLGGYATHWVPSLRLDELCHMLWDMIRYENFDEESPYNREAAIWVQSQEDFRIPLDVRPLRDRVGSGKVRHGSKPPVMVHGGLTGDIAGVKFLDADVVEAEVIDLDGLATDDEFSSGQDIVFID